MDVIVINWNYERYLRQFFESLENQKARDFRVLFYDNHSSDKSIETADQLLRSSNFEYEIISRPENHTIANNLNYVMDHFVRSQWVFTISSDDWLLPGALFNRMEYVKAHPAVDFLFGTPLIFFEQTNRFIKQPSFREKLLGSVFENLLQGNFLSAPGSFIKVSAFKEVGGYDPQLLYEDWDLWLRAAKFGKKMDILDDYQVVYRRHPKSISYSMNMQSYWSAKQTLDKYKHEPGYRKALRSKKATVINYATDWTNPLSLAERLQYFKTLRFWGATYLKLILKLLVRGLGRIKLPQKSTLRSR